MIITPSDVTGAYPVFLGRTDLEFHVRAVEGSILSFLQRKVVARTTGVETTSVASELGAFFDLEFPIWSLASVSLVTFSGLVAQPLSNFRIVDKRRVVALRPIVGGSYVFNYECGYDSSSFEFALLKLNALKIAQLQIASFLPATSVEPGLLGGMKKYKYKNFELEFSEKDLSRVESGSIPLSCERSLNQLRRCSFI